MKPFRIAIAIAIVALAIPELARYRGERELYRLTASLQGNVDRAAVADDASNLSTYPADWRALQIAGRATLSRSPGRASNFFRAALARGERPELDYDLGLARLSGGDARGADAAFLRACWVNPALATMLEGRGLRRYADRVAQLENLLRQHRLRLSDVPPPP